jgi:Asp-tRNA(Asn)/Glu-tRNA(Gln) amidotransferase A subunit family amidase
MSELASRGPGGLNLLTATEAAGKLRDGSATSVELVEHCLARIAAREPDVHAWAFVDRDIALDQARARDREQPRSPLRGVPVGIKDIFDTCDMPTAYGSQIYKDHRPANDTAVVALLRLAGAVIMGKCVTTEFASPVPIGTRNPHDLARSPGVSSSGSAAAVADFMVPLAVGSQTGGSTILPAAFCGVVGYKASLTGIDRGGIRHLRPTIDTMGLFARSFEDIALLRAVLVGAETAKLDLHAGRIRIGVCRTPQWGEAQPETADALERGARALAAAGAEVIDAELPDVFAGIEDSFRVIVRLEGARAMDWETRHHLATMNHWLRRELDASSRPDEAQYERAQAHSLACRRGLAKLFTRCDAIITPSTCGEAVADLVSVSNSAFNRVWTLMWGPCLTIPAFTGPNGMPVGLQVVGPVGADDRTIALAAWIAARLNDIRSKSDG